MISGLAPGLRLPEGMKRHGESRRRVEMLMTAGSMLALALLAGAAGEAQADHALAADSRTAWRPHLERVDTALGRGDVRGALLAWREAYAAALASRHWEGLIDAADAYLRVGDAGAFRNDAHTKARTIYRAALFRARQSASLAGLLRTAEALADLGDGEGVEQALRLARALAALARDARGEEQVRRFAERWAARPLGVERFRITR